MGWFHDEYGKDAHPILPIDLYGKLNDLWNGDEEAVADVVRRVQDGKMSVTDVIKALKRSNINPKEWRKFEDGWRPEDWD